MNVLLKTGARERHLQNLVRVMARWLQACADNPVGWSLGLVIAASVFSASSTRADQLDEVKQAYAASDYDRAIRLGEEGIKKWAGKDQVEGMRYLGWSYYLKGRLLLAAHESAAGLTILYADCLTRKSLVKKESTPIVEGIAFACLGDYKRALAKLKLPVTTRMAPEWRELSLVWQGCLYERMGKQAERDESWKSLQWSSSNTADREGVRGVLGVYSRQQLDAIPDKSTAREIALSLDLTRAVPREGKVKLLSNVRMGEPFVGKAGDEVFYDVTGYLSAGRLCLDISRDLFEELGKVGASNADDRFARGFAAYLLHDAAAAAEALEGLSDERSTAVRGAALYLKGQTQQAKQLWQQLEGSGTPEAKLWLGYAWANLGLFPEKAAAFVRENPSIRRLDAGLLGGIVFESLNKADDAFDSYNMGYRYDKRSIFGLDANSGELVVRLCTAAFRASQTDMGFVIQQLLYLGEKYEYLKPLHGLSSSLTICKKEF